MYDILIIGGGINGAGIARDAAGRGLNVLLCEKDDLASHTSSASTKLIHGGLRYLEQYDFALVRKALKEREVLLNAAPHIIWPLRFVLPHHKDLRPAWLIRLGLFLYDHIGGRKQLPATRTLTRKKSDVFAPLKQHFVKGFEYSDCWVDDARLVVLNAIDAADRGAEILTRTACTSLSRHDRHWSASLQDDQGQVRRVDAKTVINAAGPWVDAVDGIAGLNRNAPQVRLVKGSHIIVPKLFDDDRCFIFQARDGRIVFAIPYEDRRLTLVGTTDLAFDGDLDAVTAAPDEIAYLCDLANEYFERKIAPSDVVSTYSGVRPLYEDQAADASSVTRDYVLKAEADGGAPIVSVVGGKITTYRKLSEDVLALLADTFPALPRVWTETAPLPGGDLPDANFDAFKRDCAERYPWLGADLLHRLARTYGTRLHVLLDGATSLEDLGTAFGAGLYQRELDYLVAHEFATLAEDIVWRRTKLGLHMSNEDLSRVTAYFETREGV